MRAVHSFESAPANRMAVRIAFAIAGFAIACWAPLIPFAKQRVHVNDAGLGLLLLCLGIGSVCAMAASGPLSARCGSRPLILAGALGATVLLPMLAVAPNAGLLAPALLGFGASLGSLGVAMNVQAVDAERAADRSLMSGFHAMFSIGGLAGAALTSSLLLLRVPIALTSLSASLAMLAALLFVRTRLLPSATRAASPWLGAPRGFVMLLAAITAIVFLVEGAMLDWGALLAADRGLIAPNQAGVAYALFAAAMTTGRLLGDHATDRLGDKTLIVGGGLAGFTGFVFLLLAALPFLALSGFILIGLGVSNIVPALFRRAASQTSMPAALAIGALTTTGYAAVLIGPAAIGFVAQTSGLQGAFWMLGSLLLVVSVIALKTSVVTRGLSLT